MLRGDWVVGGDRASGCGGSYLPGGDRPHPGQRLGLPGHQHVGRAAQLFQSHRLSPRALWRRFARPLKRSTDRRL